nr:MAG TPA: hypothetical protein [Caudoviricetes sp.]
MSSEVISHNSQQVRAFKSDGISLFESVTDDREWQLD